MLSFTTKILVVDDMKSLCEIFKSFLTQLGYTNVTTVNSVEEAKTELEVGLALNDPIKLVFSDINMPGATGLELLEWIRKNEQLKKTLVVMVSSMGDEEHVIKAAKLGTNGFLVKPVKLDTLQARLEKL
jgi:two-component system, chemotaxis family, chemotaxis protein CheY